MGPLTASLRLRLSILAAVIAGLFTVPAAASACTLQAASDVGITPGEETVFEGNFKPDLNGQFIQIPFTMPAGQKGMRIRYCYDGSGTTLDLGVYGPKGGENWTMGDLRGWTGSALRVVGIGENGYSDEATYDSSRKAYVPFRTTRGFSAGPMAAGTWAVELGAGWIDPSLTGGTNWKVGITTSADAGWADDGFQPDPYQPYVANPNPGWYTGDLHVHGEHEPGNATMRQTFDLGFGALPTGSGLDFMTLVDHNNTNALPMLGAYTDDYPGKLIIPGTEITTYDGHLNSQNASSMVDFRMSSIHRFPGTENAGKGDTVALDQADLADVRGPQAPAEAFAEIDRLGGWGQINHPDTYKSSPASCRGCAWTYSDEQTGFGDVDAIEVANGIAGLPISSPTVMNPFTPGAVEFYERALAAGNRIAAVASSDDHRAGHDRGLTDPIVGEGATVVYADQLSPAGITEAVKAGHTYVKVFGPSSPDVLLTATTPDGKTAIPGDEVTGERLNLAIEVNGAGSNPRPGSWKLEVLKDGIPVDEVAVTGDRFTHEHVTDETGRYSFRLTRKAVSVELLEAYSTPVWFTWAKAPKPAVKNNFAFGKLKLNRKRGIATLRVRTAGPGRVVLRPGAVRKSAARATARKRVVVLKVRPKAKVKRKLRRRGRAKVRIRVTFAPQGGKARTKARAITLRQKVRKRR